MKKFLSIVALGAFSLLAANSQVLLSGGLTYSQNFDSLSNQTTAAIGTTVSWTDNATVGVAGWYASRAFTAGTTSVFGPYAYTGYRVADGTANNGTLNSYGIAGVNSVDDRALGSLVSGTPKTNIFGLRVQNDTASAVDTVTLSYAGEQWRNGGNTAVQKLAFSYRISGSPFTSPIATDAVGWTAFGTLDFLSPTVGAVAAALDGNAAANRTLFSGVLLTGVTLNPGEEIFFRWLDIDDSGSDHALAVDDFAVSFSSVTVPEPAVATIGGLAALAVVMRRRSSR